MLGASQKISNSSPDPEQIRQWLRSEDGQTLLRILQADGGAGLRAASEALRGGDTEGAKAALTPLLAGKNAEALTRSLEEKL